MSKEFSAVARSVVEKLGGANNVVALTHCMTRLRFVLKDEAKIDASAIKGVKGVMGVVHNGDQCQVIIGNNVAAAYKEVMKLLNFDGAAAEDTPAPKVKLTPKVIGAKMLDALVGTMSPLIPAIIGGSMVKLAAMLLLMFNIYEADHSTIILLNTIGDGAFFFLPIMVAASAAIKFKTNMSLAIGIAGVLVHPNFIDLMAQAADGRAVELFGIPVTSVRYTYTVIPVLIMTWIQSYIERWVDSITPAVTKNFLKPMLIVLIAAPIGILLVGPMGIWIGTAISTLVYAIHGALVHWLLLSWAHYGRCWYLPVCTAYLPQQSSRLLLKPVLKPW